MLKTKFPMVTWRLTDYIGDTGVTFQKDDRDKHG